METSKENIKATCDTYHCESCDKFIKNSQMRIIDMYTIKIIVCPECFEEYKERHKSSLTEEDA